MSDTEYGLTGLKFAAAFAVVLFAYFRLFVPASLAAWRQDVFASRNKLWDAMRAAGRLDSPGHHHIRDCYNGALRLAESITLMHFVFSPKPPAGHAQFDIVNALQAETDPEVRQALSEALQELHGLIRGRLFFSFPGVLLWVPLMHMSRLLPYATTTARRKTAEIRKIVDSVEDSAAAVGKSYFRMAA